MEQEADQEITKETLLTSEETMTDISATPPTEISASDLSADPTHDLPADLIPVDLITDEKQIVQVLEAVIFAAPRAMSILRLKNLLKGFRYDISQLSDILGTMIEDSKTRGIQLIKVAGGYQYRTHPEHAEVMQKLLEDKPARLSASALEVLAIIAYKQPLSRADVDNIRGVDSGHLLRGLLEKNLVRTLGHAETPGRPLLYGTAPYFLEVFSLGSLDDLPAIEEFQRELAPTGAETASETIVLGAEPGVVLDSSSLASNPERGSFDAPIEDVVEHADFGEEDRAKEAIEHNSAASEAASL